MAPARRPKSDPREVAVDGDVASIYTPEQLAFTTQSLNSAIGMAWSPRSLFTLSLRGEASAFAWPDFENAYIVIAFLLAINYLMQRNKSNRVGLP